MFSVTQHGKELDKSKYVWDENNKVFSTKEDNLVLDFSDYDGITFNTNHSCIFSTGDNCTFNTEGFCVFMTGSNCTFNTNLNCTFNTGDSCTFNTGRNCFVTRYDVNGAIEIPVNKVIRLNEARVSGYNEIKKNKENNCDGKVIVIDGKKYKLQIVD